MMPEGVGARIEREPPSMENTMPAGFVKVSQDRFFQLLSADPRDIMPSLNHPDFTIWETRSREPWGWSCPGWRNIGLDKVWAVTAGSAGA